MTSQQVYNLILSTSIYITGLIDDFDDIDPRELAEWGHSVAKYESMYDTKAKNPASSAKGLMQLVDKTKEWMEKKYYGGEIAESNKMYDPKYNVKIGLAYLAYLFNRYKHESDPWKRAVIAYYYGHYKSEDPDGYWKRVFGYNKEFDYGDLGKDYKPEYTDLPKQKGFYLEFT